MLEEETTLLEGSSEGENGKEESRDEEEESEDGLRESQKEETGFVFFIFNCYLSFVI